MSKVISFEKFVALKAAGLDVRAQLPHAVMQLHSTDEAFEATLKRRASDGARRGY
mgnify:CR=1 FL=1